MFRYILFDLDNTLYPQASGLWEAIGRRINLYMVERLGYRPEEVNLKRDGYLQAFGTTLNALRHYYGIDSGDFLEFVHDIPLEDFLRHEPELDAMLARMPQRKVIFTNADAPHAERVLRRLGVSGHFDRIIDIRALDFHNKPDRRAYLKTLELLHAQPQECVFVEDSITNLIPARSLGMTTVLVGDGERADEAHHRISRITDLEDCLTGLAKPPVAERSS